MIPEEGEVSLDISMSQVNLARLYKNDLSMLCCDNIDMFLQTVLIMILEEGEKVIGYQYVSDQSCQAKQK